MGSYHKNIKKVVLFISFILLFTTIFLHLPGIVAAAKSDFLIKNGVLVKYQGNSKNVIIPKTVTSIGQNAFGDCTSLVQITMPNSVTSISDYAFFGCTNLVSVTIPDMVTSINKYTFYGCTSLKTINIPETVTSIGQNAFCDCTSLTKITIPPSVKEIGVEAFKNTPWFHKITKENPFFIVNNILFDANKCKGKVTVPDGVTVIGANAFRNSSVTEVILQEGITKLGEQALSTSTLKKVTLPEGLIEIGSGAFERTKLRSIQIPISVETIGARAFYQCDYLKTVIIPEGVTTIGNRAFASCQNLIQLSIPKSAINIEKNFIFNNNSLTNLQVSPDHPNYAAEGCFLLNKDKTVLICCAKGIGEIIIPEGIVKVTEGAFGYSFNQITKIMFPGTLNTLEDNVFDGCYQLTEITLPSSLMTFGQQRFDYCTNLNSINVYEINNLINYVSENGILYNADKTTLICNPATGEIVVPDTVTSIGNYAFPNAKISVSIPKSVTSLGEDIFIYNNLWKPANEEPFYICGYTESAIEKYCINKSIRFLAFDAVYTIKYVLEGGRNASDNPTTYTYESNTIKLQNPSKPGYKFMYWYKDISICEDGCCRGEKKITIIPKKSLGDIELIAKWKKVK